MDIIKRKIITVFLIVLLIGIILAIGYIITGKIPETFDIMNTTIPIQQKSDGKILDGYYKTDANNMAKFPYGTTVGPLPFNGVIPDGYYKVTVDDGTGAKKQQMAQVPYGYTANPDKTDIYPTTKTSTYGNAVTGNTMTSTLYSGTPNADVRTSYNSDNLDLQYHDDANAIIKQDGINSASFNSVNVLDQNGVMQSIPYSPAQSLPIYYSPGSFVFGASSYVPNYEDSVYLSRTTGLSTVGQAYVTSSMNGGFCNSMTNNSLSLEQKCQSLPSDVCSSTSCCVLLGGSKCVAGDGNGPTMKANYTDPSIINKDVYYYQGKCYGNCS
jgi:hypothetical protein